MFRFLFSMAEGGCEKFPDHWNTEFFWTVIVEYISHGHPVAIIIIINTEVGTYPVKVTT